MEMKQREKKIGMPKMMFDFSEKMKTWYLL